VQLEKSPALKQSSRPDLVGTQEYVRLFACCLQDAPTWWMIGASCDPPGAWAHRRARLLKAISIARSIAGWAGFLILHSRQRPER
jgi:hypothetical protein